VSSDPDWDTVWSVLTTTGSAPSNYGLTVAYAIAPTIVWGLLTGLASSRRRRSAGLEEIPAPDDLSGLFDQSYQTEFSRAGGLEEKAAERQELSRYPTSHRRVYWAGEKEPLGKPEKKRAALAHFDTIFSLDKIMVQLTIQAVLVSRKRIVQLSKLLGKGCQYSLDYD